MKKKISKEEYEKAVQALYQEYKDRKITAVETLAKKKKLIAMLKGKRDESILA